MPKEITILLPDSSSKEYFDIHIESSISKNIPSYRFEVWDLEKDKPKQLTTADYLKQKINAYSKEWIVAEIYAEENKKVPILLRKNN